MSPELRERLIALLQDVEVHVDHGAWGFSCACCGHRDHKPDCELAACLQELRTPNVVMIYRCSDCNATMMDESVAREHTCGHPTLELDENCD